MADDLDSKVHRTADFISRFANNARFESYGTDLKIIFGSSDMGSGTELIDQHTAITMAWPEAKTFAYYLLIQLIGYEVQLGLPIPIHPISVPRPVPDEVKPAAQGLPRAEEVLQAYRDLRERFFSRESGGLISLVSKSESQT